MGIARETPSWLRESDSEGRLTAIIAIAVAMVFQLVLPEVLIVRPRWLVPGIEILLILVFILMRPTRLDAEDSVLRTTSLSLAVVLGVANVWSVLRLMDVLLKGELVDQRSVLFGSIAAVWLTNLITFALWYWELDRGGPAARANGRKRFPDFQFVQMTNPELAPPHWRPMFLDYLYLSFTNAVAYSPTDVMPMTRWAKLAMMGQSMISLVIVALVIGRVVNIV